MFQHEATLYRAQARYFEKLVENLDDERFQQVPVPGVKPPIWILGHLAISNDYALRLLGRPTVCSTAWHQGFGPGSDPLSPPTPTPTKAELIEAFGTGHRAVLEALPTANPEAMAAPHPLDLPFLKQTMPTVGDLLAHLLTTHLAYHLGQFSTWRRVVGLPEVL